MFDDINSENPRTLHSHGGGEGRPQQSPKFISGSSQGKLSPSSHANPCPICGRSGDGDCRIGSELVLCHRGKSHHPPAWAIKKGDHGRGHDGQHWACLGETADGRALEFRLHQPKPNGSNGRSNGNGSSSNGRAFSPLAAAPPAPAPEEILLAFLPSPTDQQEAAIRPYYDYAPGQRIRRKQKPDGGKSFWPQHLVGQEWKVGAGPTPWPVYAREEALAALMADPDRWLLEVEGEKCTLICHQAGIAAISQPGHAHKVEQIEPRYRELKEARCGGVIFLADNDKAGEDRARQSADAAVLAGLPFLELHASDVWPDLPQSGSIDDAPGTPEEIHGAVLEAVREGKALGAGPATPKADASRDIQSVKAEAARLHNDPTIEPEDRSVQLRAFAAGLGTTFSGDDLKRYLMRARQDSSGTPDAVRTGDRLSLEAVPWSVEGLLLRSAVNLVVAREKVGKTSLLVALVAAWHYGCETFLDRRFHGPCPPVIILGTDMPSSDWARLLRRYHLADETGRVLEPIKYLFHSGVPIYLDGRGLSRIAQIAEEYPGALFICDSYARLTAPLGLQEASADFATPLMDLQAAIDPRGCTAWVIHHSGKGGITGRVDSRGTTALPAVASQIIYMQPMTENEGDRRITLRTSGRGGAPQQLLIEQDEATGTWISHGDGRTILRLQALEKAEQKLSGFPSDVLELVRQRWTDQHLETGVGEVQERTGQIRQNALLTLKGLQDRGLLTSRKLRAAGAPMVFRPAGEAEGPFECLPTEAPSRTDSNSSKHSNRDPSQPGNAKPTGETGLNYLNYLNPLNECVGRDPLEGIQTPEHLQQAPSPAVVAPAGSDPNDNPTTVTAPSTSADLDEGGPLEQVQRPTPAYCSAPPARRAPTPGAAEPLDIQPQPPTELLPPQPSPLTTPAPVVGVSAAASHPDTEATPSLSSSPADMSMPAAPTATQPWLSLAQKLREQDPPLGYMAIQDRLLEAGFGEVKAKVIRDLLPPLEQGLGLLVG